MNKQIINIPAGRSDKQINGFIVTMETAEHIIRFIIEDDMAFWNPGTREANALDKIEGIASIFDYRHAIEDIGIAARRNGSEVYIAYEWNKEKGDICFAGVILILVYTMGEWERK